MHEKFNLHLFCNNFISAQNINNNNNDIRGEQQQQQQELDMQKKNTHSKCK